MAPQSRNLLLGLVLGSLASCGHDRGFDQLLSVEVAPAYSTIPAGTSHQFAAMGHFPRGVVRDVTDAVTWTSSDPAATVGNADGNRGMVSGMSVGSTTIAAAYRGVSGATRLTVGAPLLVAIGITPANPVTALGTQQQCTAMGTYSDGSVQGLTATAVWSSSNTGVALVAGGLTSGVGVGTASITATVDGVSGSVDLVVTAAALVSIDVTPTSPSIALGTSQQFTATGIFTDSSHQDLTASATWQSSATGVATVSNAPGSEGLAASIAVGSASISATWGGVAGATSLTVTTASLVSIDVTPTNPSIALGTSQQFAATGTFTDASTQDLTASATWSSSATGTATVSNAPGSEGLASSVAVGNTSVAATFQGITGTTSLTVTAATLVAIAVTPANPSIALGTSQQFTATGTYTDASTQDLTASATWSSSATGTATVSNAPGSEGLASSAAVGGTTIGATVSGVTGTTTLSVTAAALVSIGVTPAAPSIALGTTQQFTATGTYTDASTQDLTASATWSSSVPGCATVSNAPGSEGLATSVAAGSTTIAAIFAGITGSTTLTVTPAALVAIAVNPVDPTIATGASEQLTATGTYTDFSTQDITTSVTWSSSAPGTVTVSNATGSEGLATGVAAGAATITASLTGITGSTMPTIVPILVRGFAAAGAPSGVTTLSIATPGSAVAGDLMLASVAVRPHTATITQPTGWVLVARSDNSAGNSNSLAVFRRRVTVGEPASHDWTFSASTGSAGGIAAFSGVDGTTPIDVQNGQATPSGLVHSAPGVTTTVPDTMLWTVHCYSSSELWTPPAGMTELYETASVVVPNGAGISMEGNYVTQPVAGATGVKSASAAASADTGNAIILALRP